MYKLLLILYYLRYSSTKGSFTHYLIKFLAFFELHLLIIVIDQQEFNSIIYNLKLELILYNHLIKIEELVAHMQLLTGK